MTIYDLSSYVRDCASMNVCWIGVYRRFRSKVDAEQEKRMNHWRCSFAERKENPAGGSLEKGGRVQSGEIYDFCRSSAVVV